MAKSIVGVHGVNQLRYEGDPSVLEREWASLLAEHAGVDPAGFSLAYYAPTLSRGRPQGDILDALDEDERMRVAEWLYALGVPAQVVQGPATAWLRGGIDWLVRKGLADQAAKLVVGAIFREVATYTSPAHADKRGKARAVVTERIRACRPGVIVAHSLGTVVTYEALWENPDLEVDTLVTLGSPLALTPTFYDVLDPKDALQHRRPPNVGRWINFADIGDLIAVPKHLTEHYEGIERDDEVTIGFFAFHGISAYLAHAAIAAAIGDAMK